MSAFHSYFAKIFLRSVLLYRKNKKLSPTSGNSFMRTHNYLITCIALPTLVKAAMALSRWAWVCAADSYTRMRACPFATTGKKNPIT